MNLYKRFDSSLRNFVYWLLYITLYEHVIFVEAVYVVVMSLDFRRGFTRCFKNVSI